MMDNTVEDIVVSILCLVGFIAIAWLIGEASLVLYLVAGYWLSHE